nr:hypothetical protein [Brevibacillus laterosporus]
MKRSIIWKWIANIFKLIWGLVIIGMALLIFFIGFFMLTNDKYIQNTVVFNQITLFMGILSLPGAMITLFEMIQNRKKELIATTKCPNCKHLIELKVKEKE